MLSVEEAVLSVTGTTNSWKISGTDGVMRAALWVRTDARLPPLHSGCKLWGTEGVVYALTLKNLLQRSSSHPLLWFSGSPVPIPGILRHPRRRRDTGPLERVDSQRKQRRSSPLIHGIRCTCYYLLGDHLRLQMLLEKEFSVEMLPSVHPPATVSV